MTESNSEGFGNVPNASANFGTFPQGAEEFRTVRNEAERSEQHTLTVREVARCFEDAGVPRTERSIINWCQPNRQGIARLDAFFDTNQRRYFISPQSVDAAIQEELAKALRPGDGVIKSFGSLPKNESVPDPHRQQQQQPQGKFAGTSDGPEAHAEKLHELERENLDLKIANRGKDMFIEQLQKEREGFALERESYVERLVGFSRKVGELSTRLLQLGTPETGSASRERHGVLEETTPRFRTLSEDSETEN